MNYIKTLIKGILAGICISIGGWLCLKTNAVMSNNILGAFLFPIGLILICNFGYFLYTGKICYLFENKEQTYKTKIIDLCLGLCGNMLGCLIISLLLNLAARNLNYVVFENVQNMVLIKVNYKWYEMIILSAFCGMLVYVAVEGFKVIENIIGKYVVLILAIAGFIICGFEHSVANMFYYFLAGDFSYKAILSLLICVVGNSIGGLFIPVLKSVINK